MLISSVGRYFGIAFIGISAVACSPTKSSFDQENSNSGQAREQVPVRKGIEASLKITPEGGFQVTVTNHGPNAVIIAQGPDNLVVYHKAEDGRINPVSFDSEIADMLPLSPFMTVFLTAGASFTTVLKPFDYGSTVNRSKLFNTPGVMYAVLSPVEVRRFGPDYDVPDEFRDCFLRATVNSNEVPVPLAKQSH